VALLTAFYMFRMIIKAFFQEPKLPAEVADHVEDSGRMMTVPLMVLAVLSLVGGLINVPGEGRLSMLLAKWLHSVVGPATEVAAHGTHHSSPLPGMVISSLVALAGIGLAWWMYQMQRGQGARLAGQYPRYYRVLAAKYWLDEVYQQYIVAPGNALATLCAGKVDAGAIDGSVNGLAGGIWRLGQQVTRYQPGFVRSYALWFVAGAVGVVGYLALQSLGAWAAAVAVLLVIALVVAIGYVARPGDEG